MDENNKVERAQLGFGSKKSVITAAADFVESITDSGLNWWKQYNL